VGERGVAVLSAQNLEHRLTRTCRKDGTWGQPGGKAGECDRGPRGEWKGGTVVDALNELMGLVTLGTARLKDGIRLNIRFQVFDFLL